MARKRIFNNNDSGSLMPNFTVTNKRKQNIPTAVNSKPSGLPPTSPKKMSILSTGINLDKAMKNINKRSGVSLKQLEAKWELLGLPPQVEPLSRGISRSTVGSRGSLPSRGSLASRGSLPSRGSVPSRDSTNRDYSTNNNE